MDGAHGFMVTGDAAGEWRVSKRCRHSLSQPHGTTYQTGGEGGGDGGMVAARVFAPAARLLRAIFFRIARYSRRCASATTAAALARLARMAIFMHRSWQRQRRSRKKAT